MYQNIDYEISELKTLEIFLDIIKFLDHELKDDINIIFKVHPSEDIRYYQYLASKFKKLKIIGKTSLPISDFILGSFLSVSTRCTTAIEAKILRVPSICIGYKYHKDDSIPINNKKLNIYSLDEFKEKYYELAKKEEISKSYSCLSNLKENKKNQESYFVDLQPLMMLEENLYSWNKGIYNDDKPIKEIKNYYEDNSNLTRGTLYILIYTFFSSIFLRELVPYQKESLNSQNS